MQTMVPPASSISHRHGRRWMLPLLVTLSFVVICTLFVENTALRQLLRRPARHSDAPRPLQVQERVYQATQQALTKGMTVEYYPESIFSIDWEHEMPSSELLQLNALHVACLHHKNALIPYQVGVHAAAINNIHTGYEHLLVNESDPDLRSKLAQCPDIDIFLPLGIRGHGYCEDAIAYTKFLQSRMLPRWAVDYAQYDPQTNTTITYHSLCPDTPMLFMNHYWDHVPDAPSWPSHKKILLMPNIEMYELTENNFHRADIVLCKTAICHQRIKRWYSMFGNPKQTQVLYTRHTTSDITLTASFKTPKDFEDVRFLHTVGTSSQKGTRQIIECWLERPDLPPLDMYMHEDRYQDIVKRYFDLETIEQLPNLRIHRQSLSPRAFGQLIANATFFLCPSVQEGYGHYLNQARAAQGLVLTTDVPPMNELITKPSGILIHADRTCDPDQFLCGTSTQAYAMRLPPATDGLMAAFSGQQVCDGVDQLLDELTPANRSDMARRARQQYLFDTVFFAQRMHALRQEIH